MQRREDLPFAAARGYQLDLGITQLAPVADVIRKETMCRAREEGPYIGWQNF